MWRGELQWVSWESADCRHLFWLGDSVINNSLQFVLAGWRSLLSVHPCCILNPTLLQSEWNQKSFMWNTNWRALSAGTVQWRWYLLIHCVCWCTTMLDWTVHLSKHKPGLTRRPVLMGDCLGGTHSPPAGYWPGQSHISGYFQCMV